MKIIRVDGNRIEDVDYLKGISIFTIVIMHLLQSYIKDIPPIIAKAASVGGTGVHVFFLCSAIGLYLSYARKSIGFKEFICRRFSKLYIPYIIVIIISSLIFFVFDVEDRVFAVFSHIFLFKMFLPEYITSFGGQFWFISTIIQFYLVFIPLMYIENKIGSKKLLGIGFVVSLIWWIFVAAIGKQDERVWNGFFLQYLWEFCLGIYI